MFKTMGRIQNMVLIVAGVATAGLFGISITDIQGCSRSSEVHSADLSADLRLKISRKLKIGSTLNNRNIPGDQFEAAMADYANSLNEAQSAGLAVSDHELADYLHKSFGGKEQYANFYGVMKARYGLKVNELEDYFRDQLLFSKTARLTMLGTYVTTAELKKEFHRRNDSLTYDRLDIDISSMTLEQQPSEEELQAYFEENSSDASFQVPEKVAVSYLMVNPENIEIAEIDEAELLAHYESNKLEYSNSGNVEDASPFAEVKADVVEALTKEKREITAKQLLGELDDAMLTQDKIDLLGTYKSQLATNAKLSIVESGTTQLFSERDYMVEPLGYVFNLTSRLFGDNPRPYGGVLESGSGFYIYHLDRREAARSMIYEEAKAQVSAALSEQRQQEAALELGAQWKEKLTASGNWESLELPDTMRTRRETSSGLMSAEAKAADSAGEGVVTEPITTGSKVVLVRQVSKESADDANFEAETETLRQSLGQQKSYLMMSGLGIR